MQNKFVLRSISFSYVYIFTYLITGVLTTPILLKHFGANYFGLLMLTYTIITYINHIRIGLPESLAVLLAKSKDDLLNISLVQKNIIILGIISIITLLLFLLVVTVIPDVRIFLGNVYVLNKNYVFNIFVILILFALIKIPFDIALSVFIGFHEVYLEKIYKTITILVNFCLVLFVAYTDKNIIYFVVFAGLLDLLVSVISFIHMTRRYHIYSYKQNNSAIKNNYLLKNGILFFQLSLAQTIIWGSGILIVSHMLSLNEVTEYSLTMKIYVYLLYAFTIVNTVIAPLYGKYFSENSWNNIRKVFYLTISFFPMLGGMIWIATLYFFQDIIYLWTGNLELFIGPVFILFMGLFFYLIGYVNSFITLMYSIGEINSILFIRWKEVAYTILISIGVTYYIGIVGIALGMSLSILLTSVREIPKKIKSQTNGKVNINFKMQQRHFVFILLPSVIVAYMSGIYIQYFIIKIISFLVVFSLYSIFSWQILSLKNKIYMIKLLKYRRIN